MTITFRDSAGVKIEIDETYEVTSSMESVKCGSSNTVSLSPTIEDGFVLIHRTTDDLTEPKYQLDIIAKPATGTRAITKAFFMQLDQSGTTPLT